MPAAVLAATRRAGRDLGAPALSQATGLGPTKRRGLLRALEPKSCQRITRLTMLEAPDSFWLTARRICIAHSTLCLTCAPRAASQPARFEASSPCCADW